MASPTILLVSGFWEDPETYAECRSLLKKSGYETTAIGLSSRGHVSPGNPSMDDDIAAIRTPVQKLVESSKEVILVLHSAAGFLGSAAIESLNASARKAQGLAGGVAKIVFLAAGVAPEGADMENPPFAEIKVRSWLLAARTYGWRSCGECNSSQRFLFLQRILQFTVGLFELPFVTFSESLRYPTIKSQ